MGTETSAVFRGAKGDNATAAFYGDYYSPDWFNRFRKRTSYR